VVAQAIADGTAVGEKQSPERHMRVAIGQFSVLSEERLIFAKQLGVGGIQLNTPVMPGKRWEHTDIHRTTPSWDFLDLLELRTTCENYGLRLEAIENVPPSFYDKAMLGLPGRDEQIAAYQTTIRNMGAAGIPILGYHWMPNHVWRTSFTTPGRGGARASSFDLDLVKNAPLTHGRVYSADELWASYEYFITSVLPVAEEAGVKLALHPDDPPVDSLGGIPRLFKNFEGFERAMAIGDSPNHGLDLCLGCWSEMGCKVIEVIEHFGGQGKIFYVHFRDVQGTVPKFRECFLGEGNMDVVEVMRALKRVGFDGFMIDDHVPHVIDDTEWGHRGRAHATGYLQAMVEAVTRCG
jgi:mannonate dehydratase